MTMITHESNAAYHAHPAIGSTSVKKVLLSTVAHWRHDELKPSPAMQIGSAVHALYLEHEKPLVIKGPETRRGNLWKNLEQNLEPDQILLTEGDYNKAIAMRDALYDNRDMQQLWQQDGWTREASMYVDCEESGLKLKVKSDAFNKKLKTMIDVKTCVSAAPRDWVSQYGPFYKFLYNVQACFYLHVANLCGVQINKFCIFAVENTPHHATAAYTISKQTIDAARPLMFAALAQIKEAQESGNYKTGWDGWTIL